MTPPAATTQRDIWTEVIGQPAAVAQLSAAAKTPLHAYLFVGPRGVGKLAAARAFAAAVLSEGQAADATRRTIDLVLAGKHPDVKVIEPDGAVFRFPDPRREPHSPGLRLQSEISTSPAEARYKIVVATDFHTANDEAVGKLLKSIEEPPPSTIVVLLEEDLPAEQITIASRCARVDFGPVPVGVLREHLVQGGASPGVIDLVADAAGGDVQRARLLLEDPDLADRYRSWYSVPSRLDGTGAAVWRLVSEVTGRIDAAQGPLAAHNEEELEAFDAESEHLGQRVGARRELVDRHKRTVKHLRQDELQFGLATLAKPYRERVQAGGDPFGVADSLAAIQDAAEAFERNPIESLLLEALFLELKPLPS